MHGGSPTAISSPSPAQDDSARLRHSHSSVTGFRSPSPGASQNDGMQVELRQTSAMRQAHARSPAPAEASPVLSHSDASRAGTRSNGKKRADGYERFLPPGEMMAGADSGHKFEIQELQAVNRRLKQEIKLLKANQDRQPPELIKSTSPGHHQQLENQSPNVLLDTSLMQTADSTWLSPDEVVPACHVSVTSAAPSIRNPAEMAEGVATRVHSPKKTVTWTDAMQGKQDDVKLAELEQQQVLVTELQDRLSAAEMHHKQQLDGQHQDFIQRLEVLEERLQHETRKRCSLEDQHADHGSDVLELRTHLLAAQAHEQALTCQTAQQQQHMQQLQEQLLTTGQDALAFAMLISDQARSRLCNLFLPEARCEAAFQVNGPSLGAARWTMQATYSRWPISRLPMPCSGSHMYHQKAYSDSGSAVTDWLCLANPSSCAV